MRALWLALTVILGALPVATASDLARRSARVGPSGVRGTDLRVSPAPAGVSPVAAGGVDVELGGSNEVTIAVNPLNSQNLAMSSLFQYRNSSDGGVAWTPVRNNVVPPPYGPCGDPTLAFDGAGRLFYGYLGCHTSGGADIFIAELHPNTGVFVANLVKVSVTGDTGVFNDKPWVAADPTVGGPFAGYLYMVWTEFAANQRILFSRSVNHGPTWSPPQVLSNVFVDGFPWPAHMAVASNGDVFVGYHSQTGFLCNPDGTSGSIVILRSTDGGATFPQKTFAFMPGDADITFNVQDCGDGVIPNTDFWMQGSGQPWILPDPLSPGTIYVVANDDPDNVHASGDEGNVYIVRSDDSGMTWSAPLRVDHGPGTTLQVYPTAAIDSSTGCIAVMWYDARAEAVNTAGNYLLDVYYTISHDGGASFDTDIQINDVAFDPDRDAPIRFPGPPATRRIGEYIGVALGGGMGSADFYGIWTGNATSGQQAITDSEVSACVSGEESPLNVIWNADPLSSDRTSRSLRFRVEPPATADATVGNAAIRVTMVDLQHPVPANLATKPPKDFTTFDTRLNGVCSGGSLPGHHCDGDGDCPGGGTCSSLAACTAAGNTAMWSAGEDTTPDAAGGFQGGCARWVGRPGTFMESQGPPASGPFRAARLQCTPFYFDWVTETAGGTIAVVGAEIVPSSEYSVQAFGASCKGAEDDDCSDVSPAVTMLTRRSGDAASPFVPPELSGQPNSLDVTALVTKFKGATTASLVKAVTQLQPNLPELNADVGALDIVAAVDAVKELAYAISGPCPCPSQATCNALACATPGTCTGSALAGLGTGAMCVKTCTGGANGGEPCINNTHCDSGTCGAGFCRDRCGRCRP